MNHNSVIISGNLTRDPEVRTFDSGSTKASFSIAIDNDYKGKDGAAKKTTSYIECAAWGGLANFIGELRKGETVIVVGELRTETWVDKQTQAKRSKTLVNASEVCLSGRSQVKRNASPGGKHVDAPPANNRRATWTPAPGPPINDTDYPVMPEPPNDADIPF